MKAEQRKELERNVLAQKLGDVGDGLGRFAHFQIDVGAVGEVQGKAGQQFVGLVGVGQGQIVFLAVKAAHGPTVPHFRLVRR